MSGSLRQMRTDLGKQTGTQTGQFVDETRSKPHISPALQSYWTLRLPGLHRALWMRPQSGDRESVGLQSILADSIVSGEWRRLDYCFQKQMPLRRKKLRENDRKKKKKMKPGTLSGLKKKKKVTKPLF